MGNPMLLNSNDYVRVVNNGDELIEGRYGGIDYTFPVGEPADVPLIVAHHIFGFGGDEQAQQRAFLRLGWMQMAGEIKEARRRLTKIHFEDLPNVVELMPRKKTGRVGPLAEGGAEGPASSAGPEDLDDEGNTLIGAESI